MVARRNRKGSLFHEPSLVPLADMLTNTVGIVVFILIFTVLTAGSTVIAKMLPIEHETHVESLEYYVCTGGRIYPLRSTLIAEATRHDPDFEPSRAGFASLAQDLDDCTVSDEHLTLRLHTTLAEDVSRPALDLEITCEPVPGGGEDADAIGNGAGFFVEDLARLDPQTTALIFWVRPDSVPVYLAARERAGRLGIPSNWLPRDPDRPIAFHLGGGIDGSLTIQSGR